MPFVEKPEIDFKELFSRMREEGEKLFSGVSFTAPDTEVLESFAGLDPRLKRCLGKDRLNKNVERVAWALDKLFEGVSKKGRSIYSD